MTTVPFPSTLPSPLIQGYSFGPLNSFRRVDVSAGPPRYRLNNPNYTSLFSVNWHFSEAELQEFRLWYEGFSDLNFNRWFTINLAVGRALQGTPNIRILESLEAHFYEDWQAALEETSNQWRVSAQLETRYKPVSAGVEEAFIDALEVVDTAPTDFIDALTVIDDPPEDFIDARTPSFWL